MTRLNLPKSLSSLILLFHALCLLVLVTAQNAVPLTATDSVPNYPLFELPPASEILSYAKNNSAVGYCVSPLTPDNFTPSHPRSAVLHTLLAYARYRGLPCSRRVL